ncbi:MAG: histidinol-phosphatase HisJ family protein [Clostridiales bacterium]|nr:histidinol-phosphatase HisJ family protein [Clostridiales bacterium]
MMKTNYHTHTIRCQHAMGRDEDFVRAALDAGFDVLGFADHAPWPFRNGYVSPIRMPMEDFSGYVQSIQELKKQYTGRLDIRLGLESEYFPRYRDHMLRMREAGISYFILGAHYNDSEEENPYIGPECQTDEGVLRYAENAVRAMRTGLFRYIAHPDLFMRHRRPNEFNHACEQAADMICQAANEMRMPIEYNLAGLDTQLRGFSRGYPSQPFWAYAKKHDNTVILGVDAHEPALLADLSLWETGRRNVETLGYRLIDHLDLEE